MESVQKQISIVVPVYDEELSIKPFCEALFPVCESLLQHTGISTHVLFVNDGSHDRSQSIIEEMAHTSTQIFPS